MPAPHFDKITFIGIGLIGSSLARLVRRDGLADHIAIASRTQATLDAAMALGIADSAHLDTAEAVRDADMVMICTPMGAYAAVAEAIGPHLKAGCIVSDVGSVKGSVIRDVGPHLGGDVHLVPGHPVAGTEHSGPEAGFAELFEDRWCVLTPEPATDAAAIETVENLWKAAGMTVSRMEPLHHDQVLAMTSHLPHLIAYSIVDTATQLADDLQKEVITFSAGGFRDFTRIAASDPTMWRDVFLSNREAVLDVLGRFTEDLTVLQKAIRRGDGDALFDAFTRTRAVRRGVIDARQDTPETDKVKKDD